MTEPAINRSNEQLRALVGRLQSSLDDAKRQIAREIHDEISQALTVLSLELFLIQRSLEGPQPELSPQEIQQKIKTLVELVHQLIETTRNLTSRLRPKVLDEFGLIAALEFQTAQFQKQTGIRARFTSSAEQLILPTGVASGIFTLSQEILSNVARHAQATRVEIEVTHQDGQLTLLVRDHGRGIDPAHVESAQSLGLASMRERAASLGGAITIASEGPGKGTAVTLCLPANVGGEPLPG
jgi:signal transduction histidine kinase